MKKTETFKVLVATAFLALTATTVNATSWRIHNDVTKKAHFVGINEAMASADVQAGDTLYLDPGCLLSSDHTISKRVTLIGTGWASNAHQTAKVAKLIITAANVKVEGVSCTGNIILRANYITIERCAIGGYITNETYTAQYATIRQCRCYNYIAGYGSTSANTLGWTIENCIINSNSSSGTVKSLYNPVITNNIIWNEYTGTSTNYTPSALCNITGGMIQNNILLNVKNIRAQTLWSVNNSTVQNNVLSTQASSYPNNIVLDMGWSDAQSTLFTLDEKVAYLYRWHLKDDSPAKGAGVGGEDCGAFAGNYPLVNNGYPQGIPVITSSEVGVRAVDGKVSVKQTVVIQND